MNGMTKIEDLCYLQVNGQSQLKKEIEEISKIKNKKLDLQALHRNEITHEIEGKTDGYLEKKPQSSMKKIVSKTSLNSKHLDANPSEI